MNRWYISLDDLMLSLKSNRKIIYAFSLFLGLLLFFWKLNAPLTYTAHGTFHLCGENPKNILSKSLQSLVGTESSPLFHDDVKTLLDSTPVLQRVVKKLHLQALVSKEESRFKRWYRNLVAECAPFFCLKIGKNVVPSRDLFPEANSPLVCTHLNYKEGFYTTLKIDFTDETHFNYCDKEKIFVGIGELDKECLLGKNSFTLKGKPENCLITFLPLSVADSLLKEQIVIKKDKTKSSLLHISCRHRNKESAATLVNEIMNAYRDHLESQGEERIASQLQYLNERKKNHLKDIHNLIHQEKQQLSNQLRNRSFFTSKAEVEHLHHTQNQYHQEINALTKEIKSLEHLAPEESGSFTTLTSARQHIHELGKELEDLEIRKKNLLFAGDSLRKGNFDFDFLATLLEGKLKEHFDHIHHIQFCLVDKKNWSPKEQLRMEDELNVEKEFISTFLNTELQNIDNQILIKRCHLDNTQRSLLHLLLEERKALQNCLKEISIRSSNEMPDFWLKEQNLEFNKGMTQEILKSLTSTIEERNFSIHLQAKSSTPLHFASPPLFPNSPHLFFYFLIGCALGTFLITIVIFLFIIKKGAAASVENLSFLQKEVIKDLDELYFSLAPLQKKVILFVSKEKGRFAEKFQSYLKKKKDSDEWEMIEVLSNKPKELEFKKKGAAKVVMCVTDERLQDLAHLPEETLYFLSEKKDLRAVTPLLDKILKKFKQLLPS